MLCCRDIPASMPDSVPYYVTSGGMRMPLLRPCNLCECACQGDMHALDMLSECKALRANSYMSYLVDADSLLDGGAELIVLSNPWRHEGRLANLMNLSI